MLTNEEIAEIYTFFKQKGYLWKVDDHFKPPTFEQIKNMVENLIETTKLEDGNTDALSGRLLVKKSDKYYDVYVHVGEVKR